MELVVGEYTYATGKIDAIKQFHVARRMAPVLLALAGATGTVQAVLAGRTDIEALDAMMPIAAALQGLSDADSEYVLHACLTVCQMRSGAGWANVFIPGGGLAFQHIDMPTICMIVVATLRDNMGNFLPALQAMPQPVRA